MKSDDPSALDNRQKRHEHITRTYLPRRTNLMIRTDGRAFSSYTRNCVRPFDIDLMAAMDQTMLALCREIQGAKLGLVQSDEVTIWATDYDELTTEPWFAGNLQKVVSVSAGVATAAFNQVRLQQLAVQMAAGRHESPSLITPHLSVYQIGNQPQAHFDSRAWTISELAEVANCLLWRAQDCAKNSLQMLARHHYSHAALEGKSGPEMHDLLHAKGVNWNDLPAGQKRGRIAVRGESGWELREAEDYTFAYWSGLVNQLAPKTL